MTERPVFPLPDLSRRLLSGIAILQVFQHVDGQGMGLLVEPAQLFYHFLEVTDSRRINGNVMVNAFLMARTYRF